MSIPILEGGEKACRCRAFLFFSPGPPSLMTFHIDAINGALQQRLLKYFSVLEAVLSFHVALGQVFPVTQEVFGQKTWSGGEKAGYLLPCWAEELGSFWLCWQLTSQTRLVSDLSLLSGLLG